MIKYLKTHSKYIIGVGAEKLFIVWGILMTIRGVTWKIMWHKLNSWERFCYLACGISDHLSFIVPILLHGHLILDLFKQFERSQVFRSQFGSQFIYISIRYTVFTTLSRFFYTLSKPSQIKKVRNYFKHWNKEL